MEEIYTTPNLVDFEIKLRELGVRGSSLERELAHEVAHFNKAIALGYNPILRVISNHLGGEFFDYMSSVLVSNLTNPNHIRLIALAPKNPSMNDFLVLNEISNIKNTNL